MAQTVHLPKVRQNLGLQFRLSTAISGKLIGTAVVGVLLVGGCASAADSRTTSRRASNCEC